MNRYAIGLGSNSGDRLGHLVGACEEIGEKVGRWSVSPLYETAPVGGPDQDPYLNAVVVVETDLGALELLDVLQQIEHDHGRERKIRWGPRTLDLDILAVEGPAHSGERLTIPHPRAAEREFVLRPLNDVWPEGMLADDLTAAEALALIDDQGVDLLATNWMPPVSEWKANGLLVGQLAIIVAVALVLATDGTLPEGALSATRALGAVMATVGVILAFISSRRLGAALTASPLPRPGAALVTSGPYRFARHPIYGGLSLFMMGSGLFLDSLFGFILATLLVPYFLIKARYEERQLRMRYAGYRSYREAVHRWLIPFLI
ncbi:MAG: 2-amino-4-hydroxy-6-hydroxymethyldihydropteridine diphosphokinase [Acidimicrobiia bacterium]